MVKERVISLKKNDILRLKIELEPTEPRVWRSILVPDSLSFHELHEIIQISMGWMHSHLYAFSIGGYGSDRVEISLPEFNDGDCESTEFKDSKRTKIKQFLKEPSDTLNYQYDFGDSWDHQITIEHRLDRSQLMFEIPRCVDGANACPPEDCGGFPGFQNLKKIIADPKDEEHQGMVIWLDGYYPNYDPQEFSLSVVNKILKIGASKYLKFMEKLYGD